MHSFLSVIADQSSQQNGWLSGGGWVVLALVNAGLAEQKNRSRLAWFLSSLLLGPFATFLIVVMAPVTDEPAEPLEVLHPFSNLGDGYLTLAGITALLAVGALLFAVFGQAWYMAVVAGVFGALCVTFLLLYRKVRAKMRSERTNVDAS